MIFGDVDMVVHNPVSYHSIVMLVSIGIKSPGRKVWCVLDLVLIAPDIIPSCNDASGHII